MVRADFDAMPVSRLLLSGLVLLLLMIAPATAGATVTTYASTAGGANTNSNGADENELRTVVGLFNQPGSEATWRNDYGRTVTWEDETVPALSLDPFASPGFLPGDYYNATVKQGLIVSTPGVGITVSQDDNTGSDADPDLTGFKDVLPAYNFVGSTGQRRMSPVGSRIVDFRFFRPGSDIPATVNVFGVELSGVDLAASTFQAFDEDGVTLDLRTIPAKTTTGLSFMGIRTTTERIARIRLQLGTDVLGTAEDGAHDVAVVDDVVYNEPWKALPSVGLAAATFTGTESQQTATITFRRGAEPSGTASLSYTMGDGSAKTGEDYTPSAGTITFAPGELSQTLAVPIVADALTEGDETFTVTVGSAQGAALTGPQTATVTIADAATAPGAGGGAVTTPVLVPVVTQPAPDVRAPTVKLSGLPAKVKLSQLRTKGLTFKVTTDEAASLEAALRATARRATLAAYNLALAERELPRAVGTRTVKLKPAAALLRGARRPKIRVSVVAIDAAGNRSMATRVIKTT